MNMIPQIIRILTLATILLPTAFSAGHAQTVIEPDATYLYVKRDTCDLFMSVYEPSAVAPAVEGKPLVMFMFGGGFEEGDRDSEWYQEWFRQLTTNGYRVISIDYRLGLKGVGNSTIEKASRLENAIHIAMEDLFSATEFIIDNAESLGVDPEKIVISGSSAGAITAMQAEYEICNRTALSKKLPRGFRYAGVMSFSGAVLTINGKLKYKSMPSPTLMLHGTADKIVPYKQFRYKKSGMYGSGYIARYFKKSDFEYVMCHFTGLGHEVAGYMTKTTDLQFEFLENCVADGKFKSQEIVR